jgi:hypothetical protein
MAGLYGNLRKNEVIKMKEVKKQSKCNLKSYLCAENINESLKVCWDKLIKKRQISKVMQRNYDYLGIRYAKQ